MGPTGSYGQSDIVSAWRHDNDYDSWRSKYDRAVSDHENHRTCDSTMVHFDDLEHEVNELSQVEQDTQQELVSYFDNQKREIKSDIRNRQAEFVEDLDENFLRSQVSGALCALQLLNFLVAVLETTGSVHLGQTLIVAFVISLFSSMVSCIGPHRS